MMRRRKRARLHLAVESLLGAWAALALAAATAATAEPEGFVGIYADPEGTQPCIQIPQGNFGTLYVIATTSGSTALGLMGAEFRIEVSDPQGYVFNYNQPMNAAAVLGNPLDLTPGDPFDDAGANIAFQRCQSHAGFVQASKTPCGGTSKPYAGEAHRGHLTSRSSSEVPHCGQRMLSSPREPTSNGNWCRCLP